MKTFAPTENIYWDLLFLKNGVSQSGKTITYSVLNESRAVVRSGTMTEEGTSGLYYFSWSGHGYTALTRLRVQATESSKVIVDDNLVIEPGVSGSNAEILTAINDADRWNDGNAI